MTHIANVVNVRSSTPADINQVIRQAVDMMSGQGPLAGSEVARALWVRIGMQALTLIHDAFIVKARGGTDEAGEKWKPLSEATVAYSRRHPGVPPAKERAKDRPSWMLTDQQRQDWWSNYSTFLRGYRSENEYNVLGGATGVTDGELKGHAAAVSWIIAKARGAKTLMMEYGDTPHEILRSTGLLLNTLTPGIPGSVPGQVFRVEQNAIIVGTNRKWAWVHHNGSTDGRIPQRRLWPEPEKWPARWWDLIGTQAREGLIDVVIYILRGGRP